MNDFDPELDEQAIRLVEHLALLQCAFLLGVPDGGPPAEVFNFKMADDYIKRVGWDELWGQEMDDDEVMLCAQKLIREARQGWNETVRVWQAKPSPELKDQVNFWNRKFPKP